MDAVGPIFKHWLFHWWIQHSAPQQNQYDRNLLGQCNHVKLSGEIKAPDSLENQYIITFGSLKQEQLL